MKKKQLLKKAQKLYPDIATDKSPAEVYMHGWNDVAKLIYRRFKKLHWMIAEDIADEYIWTDHENGKTKKN